MEKRTERNKELYKEVNRQISVRAKQSSNEPFKATQKTLKNINPQLFGENNQEEVIETNKDESKKKIMTAALIFLAIISVSIIITVVILNGK